MRLGIKELRLWVCLREAKRRERERDRDRESERERE